MNKINDPNLGVHILRIAKHIAVKICLRIIKHHEIIM